MWEGLNPVSSPQFDPCQLFFGFELLLVLLENQLALWGIGGQAKAPFASLVTNPQFTAYMLR